MCEPTGGILLTCHPFRDSIDKETLNDALIDLDVISSVLFFFYLAFPELSPDLHPVEVPSRVGSLVVVSYPDLLYDFADILQLAKSNTVI